MNELQWKFFIWFERQFFWAIMLDGLEHLREAVKPFQQYRQEARHEHLR